MFYVDGEAYQRKYAEDNSTVLAAFLQGSDRWGREMFIKLYATCCPTKISEFRQEVAVYHLLTPSPYYVPLIWSQQEDMDTISIQLDNSHRIDSYHYIATPRARRGTLLDLLMRLTARNIKLTVEA